MILRGFSIRRDCVRRRYGVTPVSFALIQRLNQFLNQRSQLRGVALICHRSTKFPPVLLHAVSHTHLRYSGANACEMLRSMKHVWCHDLSSSVACGSRDGACSFHYWFGNFAVQDSLTTPDGKTPISANSNPLQSLSSSAPFPVTRIL